MNYRDEQKQKLLNDLTRRIPVNNRLHICEGQGFKEHECLGGYEMNEVIFTRNHIRHLTDKQKEYFWSALNCSINCKWFHENYGHAKAFRDWFVNRMIEIFSKNNVAWYIKSAPLKCVDYAWVWQDLEMPEAQPVTRADGKIVGNIFDNVLMKRTKSIHMLNRPQGWAMDDCVIRQAVEAGVNKIVIGCEDSGMVYETSLKCFLANSHPIDRDYGKQLVLPIQYWKAQSEGSQLALFDLVEKNG